MRLNNSRYTNLLLIACLGLTACSSEPADDPGAQPVSSSAIETTTTGPAAAEEQPPDSARDEAPSPPLPVAFSEVWITGSVALYLAVLDGQMVAVGVDTTTGHELYRLETHPLGRLRGVTPTIAIDEQLDQFYLTGLEPVDGDEYAYLGAYALDSGEEIWRGAAPFDTEQPFICGAAAVCLRSDSDQWEFSGATGELTGTLDATNRRVVGSTATGFLATVGPDTTPTDNLDFLAGSSDFGRTESWRISGDEILRLTGQASTPMAGWAATHAPDAPITALLLGPADTSPTSVIFGFNQDSGELLWGTNGIHSCAFGESESDAVLLCPADPGDPFLTSSIVRIDPVDGTEMWAIPLGGSIDPYSLEILVGGGSIYVWAPDASLSVHDLDTGEQVTTPSIVLCGVGGGWSSIEWPGTAELVTYRAVRHVSLCDTDGLVLGTDELAATRPGSELGQANIVTFDSSGVPILVGVHSS